MSVDISFYIKTTRRDEVLAHFQTSTIVSGLASVSARVPRNPHFHVELYGLDTNVSVNFRLDKTRLIEARAAIAELIRRHLETTTDDVVVVYIDMPIVKRVGTLHLCNDRYRDFVPTGQPWTYLPVIELLDG